MPESLPTPPARRRLLCAAILGALAGCSRPQRPDTLRAAPGSICLSEDAVPVAYPFALATILRAGKSRRQPAAFAMHEPRRGYGYAEATGTDTPVFWDVTFRFDTCDARRFMMWFVEDLERGVLEFTLPIRTEFGNLDHTCRFLPDGLLDCTEDGGLWTYRATIMARAQVIPADATTAHTATFTGPIPAQTIYVGFAYTLALAAYFTGGVGPYTYRVHSGALSPGLTLDATTGVVSGLKDDTITWGDVVFVREDVYCAKLFTNVVSFTGASGVPPSLSLPAIADDNATFNDEGTATTGWTAVNGTMSVASSYLRLTKSAGLGSSASMTKAATFTGTDKDFILYGKVRMSVGSNNIGVIWFLSGLSELALWVGSSTGNTSYDGHVSVVGTTGSVVRNVGAAIEAWDYENTPIEFALHYDKKWNVVNLYVKQSGKWRFKARAACNWFSATEIQCAITSNSPTNTWIEVDYLTLCKPNVMSIGDSICAGATLFNPDPALSLTNNTNSWQYHAQLYGTLRNNLIINKGVGSNTSAQIASRISADVLTHEPRVVFLHASSNDEAASVSLATRTTNIQSAVTAIDGAGAACVLLNAMYGSAAGADNTPTPDLRDYGLSWWTAYMPGLTNVDVAINIMQPILSGGFMDAALTEADGIHPTAFGYQDIGEFIAAY